MQHPNQFWHTAGRLSRSANHFNPGVSCTSAAFWPAASPLSLPAVLIRVMLSSKCIILERWKTRAQSSYKAALSCINLIIIPFPIHKLAFHCQSVVSSVSCESWSCMKCYSEWMVATFQWYWTNPTLFCDITRRLEVSCPVVKRISGL